jgi:hypothetical protein
LKFSPRHESLKILPVELSGAHLRIGIITVKNRTLGPVAQLFVEHAREIAGHQRGQRGDPTNR